MRDQAEHGRSLKPFFKFRSCITSGFKVSKFYADDFQIGSLAGAAHLRNDSEGDQRGAHNRQKRLVDLKGKSFFDNVLQ